MNTARLHITRPPQGAEAPALAGSIQLPAQMVWELAQALQAGKGVERDEATGEQFIKLRISVWSGSGENSLPTPAAHHDGPSP